MSIHIGADRMTGKASAHSASRVSAPGDPEVWRASWLPHRWLTRNEAITAMVLAETLATPGRPDRRTSAAVAAWAAELDLTPAAVTAYLSRRSDR